MKKALARYPLKHPKEFFLGAKSVGAHEESAKNTSIEKIPVMAYYSTA